jgi:hypothetical protein
MKVTTTFCVTAFLLMANLVFAQTSPIATSTRQVAAAAAPGGAVLEVSCQNRSDKPIAVYVFRFDRLDANGKLLTRESLIQMTRGLGLSKGRPSFQPGETWTDRLPLRGEASPELVLDLVVYEDGSHWGPNKAGKLDHIQGVKAGAKLERTR